MNTRITKIVEGLKAGKCRRPRRDQVKKAIEENAFSYFIHRGYDEVYNVAPEKKSATIENIESYWLNDGDFLIPQLLENGTKLVITIKHGYSYMELWADLKQEVKPVEKVEEVKEVPTTNASIEFTVSEDIHTKTGKKIFVAKLTNKIEYSEFKNIESKIKSIGGYYSRFKKGFLFDENPIQLLNDTFNKSEVIKPVEEVSAVQENNIKVKEVENMDILELSKCDFGYCKDYKDGDNCKKCSELSKAKGYTGCIYASNTIEIIQEPVQEVSIVEELKQESETIINSINTESLETQKTSLEAVSNQLDKIYSSIEENRENEEIRLQLRDIENELKWNYSSLDEMIEKQTCPDADDFNNIETLKTVYITNWNELPEELQNYILSCDRYWIDLQWINLYKGNKVIASISISGHHKHDIEINSIGAGELFQWNTDGYTLNNLEVSADKQEPQQNIITQPIKIEAEPIQQSKVIEEIIINESLAKRSKENMSFDDYIEGSATKEYNQVVENITQQINEAKERVSEDAQIRLNNLLIQFKKNYANWINKHNANGASHVSWIISGRGNYNMNKHNKFISREDKLWQEYNDIMAIDSKIEKIINSDKIIRTDDKNALEKLRAKLEQEEKQHQEIKEYNKQARKENKETYPTYMLTNSNQRIKNIKDRIAQLEKLEELKKTESSKEIEINGIKIIDNLEANRLQIIFDGKPDENTRKLLKSNGFRWSPTQGAWQRYRSPEAERKAKVIAESLNNNEVAV